MQVKKKSLFLCIALDKENMCYYFPAAIKAELSSMGIDLCSTLLYTVQYILT